MGAGCDLISSSDSCPQILQEFPIAMLPHTNQHSKSLQRIPERHCSGCHTNRSWPRCANEGEAFNQLGRIYDHSAPGAQRCPSMHLSRPIVPHKHHALCPTPHPNLLSRSPELLQYVTYFNRSPCLSQDIVNMSTGPSPPPCHNRAGEYIVSPETFHPHCSHWWKSAS